MDLFETLDSAEIMQLESTAEESIDVGEYQITGESFPNTGFDTREYFECLACGWCATPGKCVSSIECPECSAAVGELCREHKAGNRVTSYHEERWKEVQKLYGTYYK